jgi:hypothetical protein
MILFPVMGISSDATREADEKRRRNHIIGSSPKEANQANQSIKQ